MKKLLALSTVVALAAPVFADEANLVMVSASSGIPEGTDFNVKPNNYNYGVTLSFFIEDENLIAFEKGSMEAEGGWKMGTWPKVSEDGTQASFSISKKGNHLKKLDKLKVTGTVKMLTGSKTAKDSKKANTSTAEKIGPYDVKLVIKPNNNWGNGVEVKGELDNVKKINVTNPDGKKLEKQGWSGGFNDKKTYNFKGIKDGATVEIVYWTDTTTKTFSFSK